MYVCLSVCLSVCMYIYIYILKFCRTPYLIHILARYCYIWYSISQNIFWLSVRRLFWHLIWHFIRQSISSILSDIYSVILPSGNQTYWQWPVYISDFPLKTSLHKGLSIAMFDYQRVSDTLSSIVFASSKAAKRHTLLFFCAIFALRCPETWWKPLRRVTSRVGG